MYVKESLFNFIDSMKIAMEADDITGETSNAVQATLGGKSTITSDSNNRDEDLEKTDDIFGLKENNKSVPISEEREETVPSSEDENISNDSNDDENLSSNDDNDLDKSNDDNLLFARKNSIRDNLIQLYTVVSGDIQIIVNSLTTINDSKTIRVMNMVLNHLRNIKSFIYKTLVIEIASLDYDELLRRYITLKRVYDLCVEIMEKFFKDNKDNVSMKK